MATIKAYSDLEQSKVLAEILPIESADMFLALNGTIPVMSKYIDDGLVTADNTAIPCWSLAALISILPDEIKHDGIVNNLWITSEDVSYYSKEYDSYLYCEEGCIVDACYKMIIHLHELKMLRL